MIQFIILGVLWSSPINYGFASIPNSTLLKEDKTEQILMIKEILKLPFENRVQALKSKSKHTLALLQKLIFNPQESLEVRWRALTTTPYVDSVFGKQIILEALKSEEWYIRNAAAISLPALSRDFAVELSGKLLSDPALVVRTAAAQNLSRLNGREKETLLWEKLNSRENFNGLESLWVRRHIAKALSQFAQPGSEAKLITLLKDQDPRLHPFALRALERVTQKKLVSKKTTVAENRKMWLEWWDNKNN
ncbi:MAG: hypothetical protein K1X29_02075 [Bdellovibrionales bacterium]|nr:hypothetical protein [Bdellovibrionales bacterium]